MKKILAFILATFMVLSLVPASSFAAFDVACPSTHTMVNCETVYQYTVPATCTTHGYDVYNCAKCGAEVLDNFVNPVEHPWISGADSKHVNVAATCTTPGYEWVKKCKVCGTTAGLEACDGSCGDESCELYKRVIKSTHNYVLTGNGIGCEVEYKCTICNTIAYKDAEGEFTPSAAHKWNYAEAEIVVAPSWTNGTFNKGQAKVLCSVKGCKAEKTVEITSMGCEHYAATIVKAYAEETCFVDGSKQILECRDCKLYFVDSNKNGEIDKNEKTLKDKDGKDTKDLSYAVVNEIKGHQLPETGYTSVQNCIGTFTCVRCKTVQTETFHTAEIDVNGATDAFPASCLNNGYDFRYCNDCKTNITVVLPALGHSTKTVTVEVSCVNQGAKYTVCVRDNCTLVKEQVIDATGKAHGTVAAIVPATDIVSRGANAGYTYFLRVTKTESVKAIDSSKHTLKYTNVNNTAEWDDEMLTTDCTGYKIVQISCAYGCPASGIEFVPAANHDEYVSMKFANCNKTTTGHTTGGALNAFTERVVYSCKDCKQVIRYEDNVVTFSTQYAKLDDLKYYHGVIYYQADASYKLQKVDRTSYNGAVIDLQANLIDPSCTTTGLHNWACATCNTTYYVTVDKVKHTPVKGYVAQPSDYVGGTPATCTKAGKWDSFKCAHCLNTIILNPYTGNQQIVTDLTINPHGSDLTKKTHSSTATWCAGVAYYECTCGATFTNWDAKTPFDKNVENHTWVVLQKGVVANCNTDGKYEIKYCSSYDCRRVEVNAFFEVEGEIYEINMYTGTRAKDNASKKTYKKLEINDKIATTDSKGKWSTKDFQITAAGKLSGDYSVKIPKTEHTSPLAGSTLTGKVPAALKPATNFTSVERNASGDHTTPGYVSMQCNYCEYEYFKDYIAASKDHVNVNGQVIPADCTNSTITDRFCIYCDAVVDGDHQWTTTAPMTAPATCVQSGYEYYLCKLCGFRKIENVIPATDSFHSSIEFEDFKVEIGKQSNYAQVGTEYSVSCSLCKKNIGTAQKPADVKDAGLEILINTNDTTIIPGSTVSVEVSLASLKGVNVWALAFPVIYDAELFEFVGYEWNTAESAFQTFAVTEVASSYRVSGYWKGQPLSDGISIPSGILSIVANADAGVTVKAEELLVTLTFKAISADASASVFAVANTEATIGGSIGKTAAEAYPEFKDDAQWMNLYGKLYVLSNSGTYKAFNVEVLDDNGKSVKVNYNGYNKSETVKIAEFLDLDGEYGITLADAYKLYALIYNNEYDVRADANYDGKVDGRDLSILYAVYTGVITVEQLITPDAQLPDGFEAWMGAK